MIRDRLRFDRLLLITVGACFILALAVYYVIQRGKLGDLRLATDKTLLSGLAVALFLLTVALTALVVRNLARVLAERRSGVLGARLQAKVTFAFLFLVMIPSAILFAAGIAIVFRTLRELAPPDVEQTVRRAADVAELVRRDAIDRSRHAAEQLARELAAGPLARGSAPSQGNLARWLDEARRRHRVAAVGVAPVAGPPLAVADVPRAGPATVRASELTQLPGDLAGNVIASAAPRTTQEELAYGWRAVTAWPVTVGGEVRAAAFATVYLPESAARQVERVLAAARAVQELQQRRPAVQRLYFAMFALLSLMVLFAAVWAGLFLARQVTGPIVELARGTDELARGALGYRVPQRGRDEIGRLIASFNRMAGELQRHSHEIEERKRYIETLLEAVPVGVLSLDEGGRVTTVNRAALEVLRLRELPVDSLIVESLAGGREAVYRVVQPVLEGWARRTSREVPIQADDGQVSLEATAERFGTGGDGGVLVVLEDLTQLRRAERLAAWGEVARRLAHEIKNPLTPIRLSAERLLRRFRRDNVGAAEVIEQGVATIVREVDSLKGLVDEFTRFARLPEIRPVPGDIGEVAREAVELYRGSHPGTSFSTELAGDLPPHLIDPDAMRRAVINLLENAVGVLGAKGNVKVTTRRQPGYRSVVLEVADDGPGLPDGDRERLFLPTFTRRPGGTGLGLAIVHRVVAEHGGRIRAEDNPGGGTRFLIELPEVEPVPEDEAGAGAPEDDAADITSKGGGPGA
ncbi:MAG: HAMP domain-containing protein [Acidobacteria bacterium]|nr:HAMP domain-containing protein [Acidobacteriota bacterium]